MIIVENLSVIIAYKPILSQISASFHPGELTAILGSNGSGKSTLMKCLSGQISPNMGSVKIADRLIDNYTAQELAKMRAFLSQSIAINFPFSALDIVLMGRFPHRHLISKERNHEIACEALIATDALHLKERAFTTLSGGERQRVQMARVFAQLWGSENGYLLLDEPTSALDLKHQHHLLKTAKIWAREKNYTVCIVLHDLNLAASYADKIILLKAGEVYKSGNVDQAFTKSHIEQVFDLPPNLLANSYRIWV